MKSTAALLLLLSPSAAFAQSALIFSPNDDGVKDVVTFKLQMPEGVSISSWKLDIHEPGDKDSLGALIKSFSGKGTPPTELKWEGKDLAKRLVKDGRYLFTLSVVTPAGNQQAITPSPLIVDRAAPAAQAGVEPTLFSPNGDGVKDEATFTLSAGDPNNLYGWLLTLKDKEGAPARHIKGKGAPPPAVKWDGRGDFEEDVPDGVYSFDLTIDDLAGNRTVTSPQTVTINRAGLISTVEVVPILISPNGDGLKDEVNFRLASGSPESVERWELRILNANGKIVHVFNGLKDPPQRIVWNGQAGKDRVPDGSYQVLLSETDKAGNTAGTTPQPLEIDTTPPQLELRLEPALLSPNGDKFADEGIFHVKADDARPLESWAIKILNDVGKAAKIITGQPGSKPLPKIPWSGEGDGGQPLLDGTYGYLIEAKDIAGNAAVTAKQFLRVDRVPPNLTALADPALFSPNGDGVLDATNFKLSVQDAGPIESWSFEILDAKGKVARSFTGTPSLVPPLIVWDGRSQDRLPLPDGPYGYVLKAKDVAGNATATAEQKVIIGATRPTPEVAVDFSAISPNADNVKDVATFKLKAPAFNAVKEWTLRFRDKNPKAPSVVRTMQGRGDVPGTLQWGGERDDRKPLLDGDYTYELEVIDVAGNKVASPQQPIRIDTTAPEVVVQVSPNLFSPNADGVKDEAIFIPGYKDAGAAAQWKIIIQDPSKNNVKVFSGQGVVPLSIPWKGQGENGAVLPDGPYNYVFFAEDEVGNKNATPEQIVRVDNAPPTVSLAADPLLFSPNADGVKDETAFQLDYKDASDVATWKLVVSQGPDKLSRNFTGLGRPPRGFPWDGKNDRGNIAPDGKHEAVLWVTDEVGNTGKGAPVSLTLDTSKPLITITAETEELQEMAPPMTVSENNNKDIVISLASEVLFDIGQEAIKAQAYATLMKANHLLRRYPQRKVRVEGHADNVPIMNEQFKNNVELSRGRAKAVMEFFVKEGKNEAARLSYEGFGDSKPRATNSTEEGRRANRRVEIVLVKEGR